MISDRAANPQTSNTKVSFFQAFATATQPFQKIIDNSRSPNAFTTLAKLDQEKTCTLSYAADMIHGLTDGLVKMEQVHAFQGFVAAANLNEQVGNIEISVQINRLTMTS